MDGAITLRCLVCKTTFTEPITIIASLSGFPGRVNVLCDDCLPLFPDAIPQEIHDAVAACAPTPDCTDTLPLR